jgi:hypothetical protein
MIIRLFTVNYILNICYIYNCLCKFKLKIGEFKMSEAKEYSFESVWKTLDRMAAEFKEEMAAREAAAEKRAAEREIEDAKRDAEAAARKREYEAELKASRKEFDEQLKKSSEEWTKRMKEIQAEVGGISESNGEMAEETFYNSLERNMTFAGIEFYDIDKNRKRKSKKLNLEDEYDIVLENGDTVAIIEIKHRVRKKDVDKLVTSKLSNFRKLFPGYDDYKILLGVGGMSFDKRAEAEAQAKGIGIIKLIDDTVEYFTNGIKKY